MSNVLEVLQSIGYSPKDIGLEYQCCALYRGGDNPTALNINKSTGLWFDHVQRTGGSLEYLVELTLKGKQKPEIYDLLQFNPNTQHIKEELESTVKFNKDLVLKLKKDHSYWTGRDIDEHIVAEFGGGTADNGRMINRYVFPIYDYQNGDLTGFAGRYLGKANYCVKWKLLSKKSNWVYPAFLNLKDIQKSKEVILVESIGNMLALFNAGIRNVIVTFGVSVSPKITEFLLRLDIQKIILAFDNDLCNNGAGNKAASKTKANLLNFFDERQVIIRLPEKKDFGCQTVEENKAWFTNI